MAEQMTGNRATPATASRLVIEVGNEHFEPGQTRVELEENGQVQVRTRLEGKEDRADGRIDPARAARLLDQAVSNEILQRRGSDRHGIPDEPRYHIELYQADGRVLATDLWRSELEQQPSLGRLVAELEDIVREVTDGQMVL
jgi:hypothetical protein